MLAPEATSRQIGSSSRHQPWLVGGAVVCLTGLWFVTRLLPTTVFGDELEDHHDARLVSLGRDEFHLEAILEASGRFSLFTLASDPTIVLDVQHQTPTAYLRVAGEDDAVAISLRPMPQVGDASGRTSRFVCDIPDELLNRPIDVSVPNLRIGSRRFHVTIASAKIESAVKMPTKVEDDRERVLYLTAAGAYTRSDITANHGLTASEKFRGFIAKHDHDPQAGEALCPITRTKSNPKCTWIIAGREYAFCCPPCVDEFVRLAKESPEQIQLPEHYVQE